MGRKKKKEEAGLDDGGAMLLVGLVSFGGGTALLAIPFIGWILGPIAIGLGVILMIIGVIQKAFK